MLAKYIGGIIGLTKDAVRFIIFLLKRPHYVLVLLAAVIGLFYVNGVPPHEIANTVKGKWNAFVENRKEVFGEDIQLLTSYFNKKAGIKPEKKQIIEADIDLFEEKDNRQEQQILKQQRQKELMVKQERQMQEEVFGWQAAFESAKEPSVAEENAVSGFLFVVGADKVRVGDQTFLLKVRLLPGKATEAYQQIKQRFDGHEAKCFPDKNNPERAECYVKSLGVSETLIDFGLADPF